MFGLGGTGNPLIAMTAFNRLRGNDRMRCLAEGLSITEDLLNEALANITISALSLNTWMEVVNGTVTKRVSVYNFKGKLSFFLPYGLCLLLAIPIIILGLRSHCDNGVSAMDGGFLQILMTTTGRTELERQAMGGCEGGYENVPKELKRLKVRFGELLVADDMHARSRNAEGRASEKRTTDGDPRTQKKQASDDTIAIIEPLLDGHNGGTSTLIISSEVAT
jgi:hypothetical protein